MATPMSVLAVDDNSDNLDLLRGMLRDQGLAVRVATSGEQALRSVAAQQPDLILLDVTLPGMDGFEVCRRLKRDEAARGVPVLFISARNDAASISRAFEVGGVDYITKPFQVEEVRARVDTQLALRRAQAELVQQYEHSHRQLSERLALATAAAGVGIWDWDVPRNHLHWEDTMYALYGIDPAAFDGAYDAWCRTLYEGDGAVAQQDVEDALAGTRTFDSTFRIRRGDGALRHIRGLATVQRDGDGRPVRMIGCNWDITEAVETERALREAHGQTEQLVEERTAELAAANRAKSDFLASMSHELRTPLNAIIGFAEILADGSFGDLNDKQGRYVDHIETSGRHLLALINDVLDLSKVEAGKMELELSDVSVASLLDRCTVMIREKALKHGIALSSTVEPSAADLVLRADDRKLMQVLFNLLSNAAKFTPDGGAITCSAWCADDEVRINVTDTGIGIDPADLQRIFGQFEQVVSAPGRKQEGTGLGLSLSRRLMELHGGRIEVHSEGLGEGSTFTLILPRDRPSQDTR